MLSLKGFGNRTRFGAGVVGARFRIINRGNREAQDRSGPVSLEINVWARYPAAMGGDPEIQSADELRRRLRPFCQKHHIRRLEIFGSAARGQAGPRSDVDLLVTLDESVPVGAAALLEMAGEAEELVGAPVDFVLRSSLEKSPNRFARDHILSTAVCVYGS